MILTFPTTTSAATSGLPPHSVHCEEFARRCDSSRPRTSTRSTYNGCSSAAFTSSFNHHLDSLALIFLPRYPPTSLLTYSITLRGHCWPFLSRCNSSPSHREKPHSQGPPSQHSRSFPGPPNLRSGQGHTSDPRQTKHQPFLFPSSPISRYSGKLVGIDPVHTR